MNTLNDSAETAAAPLNDAVLAFDVGGTDMKVGLILGDVSQGEVDVRDLQRHPTPLDGARSGESVCARIAELTAEYRQSHPQLNISAVGVTVPGIVDEAAGVGVYSANLGWHDFPFAATLTQSLGLPVGFGHDVGMAGEAEFRLGAAVGRSDVLVLVIGTGIAAAVMCDGRRVAGGGYAGEIGHAMVPGPDGKLAIMESLGSAGAIARRYTQATGELVAGARDVLARAAAGDQAAKTVWKDAVDALAFGVAQCVSILGTETVVLGGGLSMAGAPLFDALAARVDELLTFHRRPEYLHAALGENAGLIGSALKARSMRAAENSPQPTVEPTVAQEPA
ncbi:ROK family protein [Arthrobacter sp.]|uniref:ROK family protein n=1 Tax=Arthrobacter sp. TaxID=1667 RepID=UPI0026DFB621|nr:ROK family protein [Arthrobacter sp.]MDO5753770.1 ROK family protein [Arthrobacter sp.]